MAPDIAYEHAVFVSYKRDTASHGWAENHFVPLLKRYLPDHLPPGDLASVFFDQASIDPGMKWPEELQRALGRSKILVPIWCCPYFASDWCMCEFRSMEKREKLVPKREDGRSAALIYPIVYMNSEHFPKDTKSWTQRCDMERWNYDTDVFRKSIEYLAFMKKMQDVSRQIAEMIQYAPRIQKNFPLELSPKTTEPPPMKLPKLRGRRSSS